MRGKYREVVWHILPMMCATAVLFLLSAGTLLEPVISGRVNSLAHLALSKGTLPNSVRKFPAA